MSNDPTAAPANGTTTAPTLADLAAATRSAAEAAQARVSAGKPLPVSQVRDLAHGMIALVDRLDSYKGRRPPTIAPTIDGQLVDQACIALGTPGRPMSRQDLAARLGYGPGSGGIIGPTRLVERPLSEERRTLLRAWIAGEK